MSSMYTRPFLRIHRGSLRSAGALEQRYAESDQTVDGLLSNGPDQFGDTLLSMEATIPAAALSWMHPQPDMPLRRRLCREPFQRALKAIIPFYHFRIPVASSRTRGAAALLVWAAIPPTTSAVNHCFLAILDDGQSAYWDDEDRGLRRALAGHPIRGGDSRCASSCRFACATGLSRAWEDARRHSSPRTKCRTGYPPPGRIRATSLLHLLSVRGAGRAEGAGCPEQHAGLPGVEGQGAVEGDRLACGLRCRHHRDLQKLASQTVFAQAPVCVVTQGVFLDASRALAAMKRHRRRADDGVGEC